MNENKNKHKNEHLSKNNITNILKFGCARINRLVTSRSKKAKILPLIL